MSPQAAAESEHQPRDTDGPPWWSPRRTDLRILGALFLLTALLVGLHVRTFEEISPIDELGHIDSMIKTSRFELPRVRDAVGEEALREEACRGFARPDPIPTCETEELRPEFFQDLGFNTAAGKFPVYHFVTGVLARVVQAATPMSTLVTPGRMIGILWLFGACVLLWLIARELDIGRPATTVSIVLMITTPVVLHMSSIINPDAVLLLCGAAMTYAVLMWECGRAHWAWPIGLAVVLPLVEMTNLVVLATAGVYLALRALRGTGERDTRSRTAALAAGILMLAVILGFAFNPLHNALIGRSPQPHAASTPEAYSRQFSPPEIVAGPVSVQQVAGEMDALVTPVKRPFVPEFLSGTITSAVLTLTNLLLVAALFGAILWSRAGGRIETLAIAALVVLLVSGPALAFDNARRDVFYAIPPRFGLSVLPLLFVFLADSTRKRWVMYAVGGLAVSSVANVLFKAIF